MRLFLIALMIFNQDSPCSRQDLPSVRIFVISQKKFRNRGHHPENNRKVIFRVMNGSTKPVIIYGFKYDGDFFPTGYMMVLTRDKNEWRYPNPSNSPTDWSDIPGAEKDKRILRPGESIKVDAEMSEFEAGSRFRRTVYATYNENGVPCEVRGEEFVLK
jgi:hypothetical protein